MIIYFRYLIIYILLLVFCCTQLFAQNPEIQKLLTQINQDSLVQFGNELTGKKAILIDGDTTIISSRNANSAGNIIAKKYLINKLKQYGLKPIEQKFEFTGNNVYALQKGTKEPEKYWIICAHYDDKSLENKPAGADDNASGTAAVLEISRVLSNTTFPYSIVYALWDNEEENLNGSRYFVENNPFEFDHIQGVINLDMIGYDSDSDDVFDIHVRDIVNSIGIGQKIIKVNEIYNIGLVPNIELPGDGNSDQASFWIGRISAVAFYEDDADFNPRYHRSSDSIYYLNKTYWLKMTKLAGAAISELAQGDAPLSVYNTNDEQVEISAGPNPFGGTITLRIYLTGNYYGSIELYDSHGRKVKHQSIDTFSGLKDTNVPTENLPRGLYFLRVSLKDKSNQSIFKSFKLVHVL